MPIERKKKFFPFGDFDPDGSEFGAGSLDFVENLVPSFGGYKSLRKASASSFDIKTAASGSDFQGINGAIGHVYLVSSQNQMQRPDGVEGTPDFFRASDEYSQDDLHEYVDSETSDTSDFISVGGGEEGVIELKFPPFETPTDATAVVIRSTYKIENNVSGTWSVKIRVLETATERLASTTIDSDTGSGTGGWKTHDETVDLSSVTDWSDLRVEYTIISNDSGDAEYSPTATNANSGNWTNESKNTTDVWDSISEASDNDADYMRSPVLSNTSQAPVIDVAFGSVEDPLGYWPSGHSPGRFVVRFRARNNHDNVVPSFRLYNSDDELVREDTIDDAVTTSASFSNYSRSITIGNIEEWGDLRIEYYASITDEWKNAEGTTGTAEPDTMDTIYPTGWTAGGRSSLTGLDTAGFDTSDFTGTYTDVDDQGDASEIVFPFNGGDLANYIYPYADFQFDDWEWPGIAYNWTLTVRARKSSGGEADCLMNVKVLDGLAGTEITSATFTCTSSEQDFDIPLNTTAIMDKIEDISSNFVVRIESDPGNVTGFVGSQSVAVDGIWLDYPAQARAYISRTYLDVASTARGYLAWSEMDMPSSNNNYTDDKVTVYAGDNNRLWLVEPTGFTNMTNGVVSATENLYANSTDPARPWDACSWGNDVIFTNYVDDVQWYEDGAANQEFSDLITSTAVPKARFCAVVRDQLVLAHCQGSGASESFSDTVWWSANGDIQDFDPSRTTLCDNQRLVDTPGQITGIVGGDYGLIFKRNSIYRMEWIGYPYIYSFKVPSKGVGTAYPKSIVQVENDVFFYSDGGFAVIEDGREVKYLNDPISRFMKDPAFSDRAFDITSNTVARYEDLAVIGVYDAYSRVIFWFYDGPNSTYQDDGEDGVSLGLNDAVTLDTRTGKWGYLNLLKDVATADVWEGPNITAAIPIYKPDVSAGIQNAGSAFFGWQTADNYQATSSDNAAQAFFKFEDQSTYNSQIVTKILQVEENADIKITRILPVFSVAKNGLVPNVSISVEAMQDPMGLVSTTESFTVQDTDGWYLGISRGEWFRFTIDFTGAAETMVDELVGFYLDYDWESDR